MGKIPQKYKDIFFENLYLGCCPNGHVYPLRKDPKKTRIRVCPTCHKTYESEGVIERS